MNDTAFLYIHRGLLREAESLLENAISKSGADAITLANYGLALGLGGHTDAADARLDAAAWWARLGHERAVVEFNRSILCFHLQNFAKAKEHLRTAVSLSPREIPRYCEFSVFIKKAMESDAEVRQLIAFRGKQPKRLDGA